MEEDYRGGYWARALEAYRGRPLVERMAATDVWQRYRKVALDPTLNPASRVAAIEPFIEAARPFADIHNVGDFYSAYVELLPRLQRDEELPLHLERATEYSLAYGDTALACQYLGMLGVHYGKLGAEDLQLAAWNRGLEVARASQSWQEARILHLMANFHAQKGEATLGLQLLGQAEKRCRELGADRVEIRFLCERLQMLALLSLWEEVDQGLERAEVLYRNGRGHWSLQEEEAYRLRIRHLQMCVFAARNDDRRAVALAREILATIRSHPAASPLERFAARACYTLALSGHVEEARAQINSTIAAFEHPPLPELLSIAHLAAAEICALGADTLGTAFHLDGFRQQEPRRTGRNRLWILHDVEWARLKSRTSAASAANEAIARGIAHVEEWRDSPRASTELEFQNAGVAGHRSLFHEINSDRPEFGYAFELAWPRLFAGRGRSSSALDPSELAGLAAEDRVQLPSIESNAVHLVYFWDRDRLIRWFRRGNSVDRDVLTIELPALRSRLERLRRSLSSQANGRGRPDRGMIRELHALGRLLLPSEFKSVSPETRIIVTRNGPLTWLPFELLSSESTTFRPLIEQHDIVYATAVGEATMWPSGGDERPGVLDLDETLVITNPTYREEARRSLSILNEALPHGLEEARSFASLAGSPIVLSGMAATRDSVLSHWEKMEQIYVSAHFVTDPELTYLRYLPLSPGQGDKHRIDLRDLRRADLSRCRLAVLSGCATGVRYWNESAELPSLGDGFLLAGARNVIATGWDVPDDVGARVTHVFNAEYRASSDDPVGALARARRRLIREGVHPGAWAAYTILSNEFVTTTPRDGIESAWKQHR